MRQRVRLRVAAFGVLAAFAVVFVLSGVGVASAQSQASAVVSRAPVSLPLTGSGTWNGQNVTFQGSMAVEQFTSSGHNVSAVGTVSGNVLNSTGQVIGAVTPQHVTVPVLRTDPSCPVLNLMLGPLHLDLLGLVVDLNQVVLTITAVSGAGNLLGNLLCAVANLLNGSAPGSVIATLLNDILNILSGLRV